MGLKRLKFEFDVEDFTIVATVHIGTTLARGDDPTVLLDMRVLLGKDDVTDSIELPYLIGFEHLALEYAYDHKTFAG